MKNDLATAIGVGIFGLIVGFVICNLFLGNSEDVTYKSIDGNISTQVAEPDKEVFNAKALNPTVEVYVGNCERYDSYGNCIDEKVTEQK